MSSVSSLASFRHVRGQVWVTLVVDAERTEATLRRAEELGVARIWIGQGRGVLRKKKWGPILLPSISPTYDILHFFLEESRLDAVLNDLVRAGRLNHFGAGSVYATRLLDLWTRGEELASADAHPGDPTPACPWQSDLIAIQCVAQLEHAEEIAHRAMEAGSPSPVISYGHGHGIRDRLNFFLQLTINPKKELMEVVVGSAEAERIFDEMVEEGRLDQPAQGFIFTRPVLRGLINTPSYHHSSRYPATMEQIIKAIDQLQGNTHWRASGSLLNAAPRVERRMLKDRVSLNCVVERGLGHVCSLAAMEAGAGGTSTQYANAWPVAPGRVQGLATTDEREVMTMTLTPDKVNRVVEAVAAVSDMEGKPATFYTYATPVALTYLPG